MNTLNWKNATPEQINLWNYVKGLIAYNTITPLYWEGAIAGSEFLTYNAGKVYMYLQLSMSIGIGGIGVLGELQLYNMANAVHHELGESSGFWDVTGAGYRTISSARIFENGWFSRIVNAGVADMIFNGYRLNV
jgi:hypothetical protein